MAKGVEMCKWECTNCFNTVEAEYTLKLPRMCPHCNKLGEFKPLEEKIWLVPYVNYIYVTAISKDEAIKRGKEMGLEISELHNTEPE